jgi:hypothetical protein
MIVTADDFQKCRAASGLGKVEFGMMLGYQGNVETIRRLIRSFEDGTRTPPTYIQRLVIMLWRHGIPDEFLTEHARETRRLKGLAK